MRTRTLSAYQVISESGKKYDLVTERQGHPRRHKVTLYRNFKNKIPSAAQVKNLENFA